MSQGFHENFERRGEVKGGSDRSFGIVFAVFFAIMALWPLLGEGAVRLWALLLAAAFLAVALVRPALLAPLNRLWTRFGLLLHKLVNPLVLGLMFLLAVTPVALVMRALGKDVLRRRFEPEAPSYWIEREEAGPAPETMRNQF